MIPTNIITIYGRKPIAEVIDNQAINIWRLHLSKTNKQSIILNQIINAAKKRNIEIVEHSRKQLSFISKNMRQDQGIACDIELPKMKKVLTLAILLRFMDSFMIYTEPFVLTGGGPGNTTAFLSIDLVKMALGQFDLGPAAAMSLIYFFIVLLVCWVFYNLMMKNEAQS